MSSHSINENISYSPAKLEAVLLYILEKIGGLPNIGETMIYKMLYFIDFDYYEMYEEVLVGQKFVKMQYGPVPKQSEFIKLVKKLEKEHKLEIVSLSRENSKGVKKKYLANSEPDLNLLSGKELDHINSVLERFKGKTVGWVSDLSHKDIPWITAKSDAELDYNSVFYRTAETSVREYERA
jgi:uncharacterized phage-associated protein